LLGIFAEPPLWLPDWQSTGAFTPLEMGLVAEIEDLGRQELVVRVDNRPVVTFTDVNPRQLKTVLNGSLLSEAMTLKEAEPEDWQELIGLFARLGKIEVKEGEDTTTRMDMVVPRGAASEVTRVHCNHQVVTYQQPSVRLADFEGDATKLP
jgi:hypothetical protein